MNRPYKALFLDLDGVLFVGDAPVPGAADAVRAARNEGLILRFLTNTATQPRHHLIEKLAAMDITVAEDELYTAPIAAKEYIQQHGLRPYCLIHPDIECDMAGLDGTDPNCVLLGDARDQLNYSNLNRAFQLCINGAALIGIGMNRYFKNETGLMLDAGPFIRAIEWAAGTEAMIMGKPGRDFFLQVVASTPFQPERCLMVGDDVSGDVEGSIHAGLMGCLVRTGKYRPGDEDKLPPEAGVIDSVCSLFT
ncbi:MAG: TIGR01458 family HAD-type hydrolase [Porticoccaceae bacterium]